MHACMHVNAHVTYMLCGWLACYIRVLSSAHTSVCVSQEIENQCILTGVEGQEVRIK